MYKNTGIIANICLRNDLQSAKPDDWAEICIYFTSPAELTYGLKWPISAIHAPLSKAQNTTLRSVPQTIMSSKDRCAIRISSICFKDRDEKVDIFAVTFSAYKEEKNF